jgi:hypothetical protein
MLLVLPVDEIRKTFQNRRIESKAEFSEFSINPESRIFVEEHFATVCTQFLQPYVTVNVTWNMVFTTGHRRGGVVMSFA